MLLEATTVWVVNNFQMLTIWDMDAARFVLQMYCGLHFQFRRAYYITCEIFCIEWAILNRECQKGPIYTRTS
jgi:hypothetical protein